MEVLNLTNNPNVINKFNNMIKKKDALVMIYSDGCPHCVEMKPVWNKFVKNIKNTNNNIFVANIPSDILSSLDVEQNIMGVPTIRLLKKGSGKRKKEYMKGPDFNALMQFYSKIKSQKSQKSNITGRKKSRKKNILKKMMSRRKSFRQRPHVIKKISSFFTRKYL